MEANARIIKNIKALIDEKGMKQKAVARLCGFNQQQFSNLLNGRMEIKAEYIPAIAMALNVTPNDIFIGKQA